MPIFTGVPPGKKSSAGRRDRYSSLCSKCKEEFKNYLKKGGLLPKACNACQEKLQTKMLNSRYPDR